MFEPRHLLYLPTAVSFEQRLHVCRTLRRVYEKATVETSPSPSTSQPPSVSSSPDCRVDTPEIARTQDCSRNATQQPLSPIGYYQGDQGEEDDECVLSPPDVALSTFPPDEDITSAFASISIGLDGEISDIEEEQAPSPDRSKCTISSSSSSAASKHGSYGALVLQKKQPKAPPAVSVSVTVDKRMHAGVQQWLKGAYLSLGYCTLVVSPQTRKRVVCTVAQDIAARLLQEGLQQQPPLLALRNGAGASRGALVVTSSKAAVEEWCGEFRAHTHVRLLAYVDSLAQRRNLGSHRLRAHDVVVTTFDVLKALEVGLPQESDHAREEGEESDDWVSRRPPPVGPVVQRSLLHLIRFRDVVLDFHELAASIRMTNKRGAAARLVSAERRCSLVPAAEAGGDVYLAASVCSARAVMGCPGSVTASSITLDAHL